jgi:hypothetical protein
MQGSFNAVTGRELRQYLINIAREWQHRFGVAPAITSALSECDAALECPFFLYQTL